MTITPEQRTYARLAGIMVFVNYVTQFLGDSVTIIARGDFAETARFAAANDTLWRFSLMQVGLSWIAIGILAFALYVVLEPVNKRLAQLALVLRLGACFVGAASLMFRVAQGRLYLASATAGLFTTEQLRTLVAVAQRGAGAGVVTAWIFLGAGNILFFLLFLRSRYLPRAIAGLGVFGGVLLVAASIVMLVLPQRTNELKLLGLPGLFADVAMALWLLIKGSRPRATAEAPLATGSRAGSSRT